MYQEERYLVDEASQGVRLDVFLADHVPSVSRSRAARLIQDGLVRINEMPATHKSEKLELGDTVLALIPKDTTSGELAPSDIPLDIRYEDEYLMVISKQAGLLTHPSPGHTEPTLVHALIHHAGRDRLGTLQGPDKLGIVHRLDAETSGLMLVAKDDEVQQALQDQIRLRELDRRYITLVHGNIAPESGLIDANIARNKKHRTQMQVTDDETARSAITTFKVLERFSAGKADDGYTLLECHLYTGRTHQIRVHMKYIMHPVVGDPQYGLQGEAKNQQLKRQFLHSWSIAFVHPKTMESIKIVDALPKDLASVYNGLMPLSSGRTPYGEQVMQTIAQAE